MRGALAAAAALDHSIADEHPRVEEGPGRDHHGSGRKQTRAGLDPDDPSTKRDKVQRLSGDLLDPAIAQQAGNGGTVELAVGLDSRTPHRWPLAAVEHAPVDRGAIGGAGHQPVKHIELAHQVALANPADRRVARHLPGILEAEGEQADPRAATGRGSRSLASGMAGANHHYVVHLGALT